MSTAAQQVESGSPSGSGEFAALWLLTLLGAVLLFTVEPLVAKLLIPSCGGAFHVWATCLTFFQGVLFLGYLYCLLLPRLGRWHLLLLVLPVLALRVTPLGDMAAEPSPDAPTPAILWALTRDLGLPFFVLSTTSVAAQTWLARSSLSQSRVIRVRIDRDVSSRCQRRAELHFSIQRWRSFREGDGAVGAGNTDRRRFRSSKGDSI